MTEETKVDVVAKSVTVSLANIERLREINKADRLAQRETKAKPVITVTGTFPTAKYWDTKTVKKVSYENGIEVAAALVTDVRVKWIFATLVDGTVVYLKNEGATATVTLTVG